MIVHSLFEIHFRDFPRTLVDFKVFLLLETHSSGNGRCGEPSNLGVEYPDGIVVALSCNCYAVFCSCKLILEPDEIDIGFQVGIAFNDDQQPAQGALQLIVPLGSFPNGLGTRKFCPCFGYLGKYFLLLCRIPLYRSDEIGDEVVSPLQLIIDL